MRPPLFTGHFQLHLALSTWHLALRTWPCLLQYRYRRTQMRFRRVRKRLDYWMVAQDLVHPGSLDPNPSAVNQPYFPKPCLVRGSDVLVHD